MSLSAVAHKASTDQSKILGRNAASNFISLHPRDGVGAGMEDEAVLVSAADEDRMINPKTQQFMAGRMHAQIRSSRVGHCPMYTATDLVVGVILQAAQESLPR